MSGTEMELAYTMSGSPVISHGKGDERRTWSLSWKQLVDMAIENGLLDKTNSEVFK